MTRAQELAKLDVERFFLIKFYASSANNDWVVVGGTPGNEIWKRTTPYYIGGLRSINTGYLEEVDTYAELSVFTGTTKYFIDRTTNTIYTQMYSLGNPNAPTFDEAFRITDYIFFVTKGATRSFPMTPTDDSTQVIEWQNRLLNEASFSFSQANSLYGILSSQASNMVLRNEDGYFYDAIKGRSSFYRSKVEIFHVVNGEAAKVYEGSIRSVSGNKTQLDFEFFDATELFNKPFYSNPGNVSDYGSRGKWLKPYSTTAEIRPRDLDRPLMRLFGNSPYRCVRLDGASGQLGHKPDVTSLPEAINCSYFPFPGTSNNRKWFACIAPALAGQANTILAEVSNWDNTTVAGTAVTKFTFAPGWQHPLAFVHPGDCFYVYVGSTARSFVCADVNASKEIVATDQQPNDIGPGTYYFSMPFITQVIVVKGGVEYQLRYLNDYTVSKVTVGTLAYYFIEMVNNFESHFGGMAPLEPEDNVYFRCNGGQLHPGSSGSMVTQIEEVIKTAGIETDPAGFTDEFLDGIPSFYYPDIGENDFRNFRDVLEPMLSSICSFLYIVQGNKFGLSKVKSSDDFNIPVKGGEEIKGSYGFQINYEDAINQLVTYNPKTTGCTFWRNNTLVIEDIEAQKVTGKVVGRQISNVLSPYFSMMNDYLTPGFFDNLDMAARGYPINTFSSFMRLFSTAVRLAQFQGPHRFYEVDTNSKLKASGDIAPIMTDHVVMGAELSEGRINLNLVMIEENTTKLTWQTSIESGTTNE